MALWTPVKITTSLWLDASDSSTITFNGSTVSQWADKSGNSFHATQGTSSLQPSVTSGGLNSLNILSFSADMLTVPSSSVLQNSSGMSIFAVLKNAQTGSNKGFLGKWGTNGNSWVYLNRHFSTPNYVSFGYGAYTQSSAGISDNVGNVLSGVMLPGTNSKHWVDGSGEYTSTIGSMSQSTSLLSIGSYAYSDISVGYVGGIAEIIIVSSALSTTDRQIIEGYLAHKWGTTSSLPADHPYKSAAPTFIEDSADIASIAITTVDAEKISTDSVQLTSILDASTYGLKEGITATDLFASASSITIGSIPSFIFEGFTNVTNEAIMESFGTKQSSSLAVMFANAESISFIERNNVKIETWIEKSELISEFTALSALVDTYQATSCLTREFTSISTLR